MYKLPDTLTEDISNFGSLAKEFEQGIIEPLKFKVTRVPMGIYEQRKDGVYMVRVRTTGGVIHPFQFINLIDIARRHNSNLLHITTRQEIQIQNLELKEVENILEELKEIGLSSKGGGGNTVRNILVSVNSGIDPDETFDLTPHAMAITSKLIAESDSFTLPRKLKLAFSSDESQPDYAGVNDLGFIARIKDGKRGYKVYLGGSVASKPTIGWLLSDFIPEENLYAVAEATKQLFSQHGNRKNKHKARLRYIFYKIGAEEVFRLFNQYYEKAIAEAPKFIPETAEPIAAVPYQSVSDNTSEDFRKWKIRYVNKQKQLGYNTITIPFIHGNINIDNEDNTENVLNLLHFVSQFGKDTIRFSTLQNVHLRNIPDTALSDLYDKIKILDVKTDRPLVINNIVSCTGADTCRLGIGLSKGLATAIRKALETNTLLLDEVSDLRIQISGCPNSCGQQVWADLGFSGKVLRTDRIYPGYQIYAGASRKGNLQLAEPIGSMNARDIPRFVVKLLSKYIDRKNSYADFKSYIESEGKEYILQLIEEYKDIPSFDDDKNYYFDWGAQEIFSVASRGVGECSAGLFDMIDLDLKYINQNKQSLLNETDVDKTNSLLYDIIYSASRMLLITKGAEPKTTDETFDLFISNFINSGLVDKSFEEIVLTAKNQKDFDFSSKKELIYKLSDRVIELYQNMDDSLQFKDAPAQKEQQPVKAEESTSSTTSRFKDLRGVACPMNFVQTKILLSTMKSGEILDILLDDGQPIANVPGSVKSEGHEVLSQNSAGDHWKVTIRKK